MNELQDEDVISRLRSALDEVTADSHGLVAADAPRPQVSAARWMAVAAAAVLVVGAVAAIAINRGGATEVATAPTDVATTSITEPVLIRTETPWFRLVAADLVPGERTFEQDPPESQRDLVMAWSNPNIPAYLILTQFPGPSTGRAAQDGETIRVLNDLPVLFESYGLSDDERETMADQVVPGSGLPYIFEADGWRLEALGQSTGDSRLVQLYTPLNNDPLSGYLPTVTMSVGDYRGELALLANWPDPQPITVAGYEGWKVTDGDGAVTAFWYVDNGTWARLRIDAQLADRADALIAGVIQVTEVEANQPTVDTVPAATDPVAEMTVAGDALPMFHSDQATDPALGLPAPSVVGFDYEGNQIRIDPAEGPQLVMFQAHWCPHCARNLPKLIEWMADGTIPSWLPVTLVSTAESPSSNENYPADKWLQEMGWTGRILRDSNEGDRVAGRAGLAYGAEGWPFFVVIDVDGNVSARASGELTQEAMDKLLEGLPDGPADPLGKLAIPTLNFDWYVLDNTLGLSISAQAGPVLVTGPIPGEGVDGEISVIWGHRTTRGAPFLDIDQLVAGDVIDWTGADGITASFEVIGSAVGEDAEVPEGTALELRAYTPQYTSRETLIVFARQIA